jgi:hypothetical protein
MAVGNCSFAWTASTPIFSFESEKRSSTHSLPGASPSKQSTYALSRSNRRHWLRDRPSDVRRLGGGPAPGVQSSGRPFASTMK